MGEWRAISPDWWKGEEGEQGRQWEAGRMTVSCINSKTDVRLSE